MGHQQQSIGQVQQPSGTNTKVRNAYSEDFVLEKSIFNNIFGKDIRRVFIYKKAERLAKALHLITPAFAQSPSLRDRVDAIAVGLVDAAITPLDAARAALSKELLTLSSVLSIARTGGMLSAMNAELIAHEAHVFLQEVADYEEPRLFFDEIPSLADIAKLAPRQATIPDGESALGRVGWVTRSGAKQKNSNKGQVKDTEGRIKDSRQEAILGVLQNKGQVSIKDISTLVRGVSEKTIQRELAALIEMGLVQKHGERRWSVYSRT